MRNSMKILSMTTLRILKMTTRLLEHVVRTMESMTTAPHPQEVVTNRIAVVDPDWDPRLRRCYHGGTIHCHCAKNGACCGCEAWKANAN